MARRLMAVVSLLLPLCPLSVAVTPPPAVSSITPPSMRELVSMCGPAAVCAQETAARPAPAGNGRGEALRLARRLEEDGQFLLAAEQYARAASSGTDRAEREETLFRAGRAYHLAGRREESRAQFEMLARESPRTRWMCEALWYWGEGLREEGEILEALRHLRGLTEEHPECEFLDEALLALGDVYRVLHRYSAAVGSYARVTELLPPSPLIPAALYRQGLALEALGRVREAQELYARISRLYPQHAVAGEAGLRRAELLGRAGEAVEAESLYRRGMESGDARVRSDAIHGLASLKARRGERREASELFLLLAQENEGDERAPSALARAGELLREEGKHLEAAATYRRLLDLYGDSPSRAAWQLSLGRALASLGEDGAALAAFDEAEEAGEDPALIAQARLERARLFADSGRPEEALLLLERVVAASPDPSAASRAALMAGEIRAVRLSDELRAAAVYELFIERHPAHADAPRFLRLLGEAFAAAGLNERALGAWRELATSWPGTGAARRAEERLRESDWHPKWLDAPRSRSAAESLLVFLREAAAGEAAWTERPRLVLRVGDVLFDDLRRYSTADTFYTSYLELVPVDENTARVLYGRGESRRRRGWLAARAGHTEEADSLRVASRADFERVLKEFPSSPWAASSFLAVASDSVAGYEGEEETKGLLEIELLDQFLRRFPGGPGKGEVLLRLAEAHARLAAGSPGHWAPVGNAVGAFLAEVPDTRSRGSVLLLRARSLLERGERGAAIGQLEEIRERFPDGGLALEARRMLAEAYHGMERWGQARDEFRHILEAWPGSRYEEEAELKLGEILLTTGDLAGSIRHLERAVGLGGLYRDEARLHLASVLAREGRLPESLSILDELENEGRGTPVADEALILRARVFQDAGDAEGAGIVYRRLLAGSPPRELRVRALFSLAEALFEAGSYEEATGYYRELLAVEGAELDRVGLESRLVTALYRQGQGVRGDEALAGFLRAHPDAHGFEAELLLERAAYHVEGNEFDEAMESLVRVRESNPKLDVASRAVYLMGIAYLKQQAYAEAEALFRQVLEGDPQGDLVPQAAFKLGTAAFSQQKYPEAAEAYREAAERAGRTPLGADASYNLALALEKADEFTRARDGYREFAHRFPEHEMVSRALFKVGYCSQELGEFDRAVAAYREVLAYAEPGVAVEVQFWVGESYAAMDRREEAAREFLKVAYLYPEESMWAATAEYRAAEEYEKLGRREEASAIYRGIVNRYGAASQWGRMAREKLAGFGEEG